MTAQFLAQPSSELLLNASDGNKYGDPQSDNMQRAKRPWDIQAQIGCLHQTPPLGLSESDQKVSKNNVRTRVVGGHQEDQGFKIQHDHYTLEPRDTLVVNIGSAWVNVRWIPVLTGEEDTSLIHFFFQIYLFMCL